MEQLETMRPSSLHWHEVLQLEALAFVDDPCATVVKSAAHPDLRDSLSQVSSGQMGDPGVVKGTQEQGFISQKQALSFGATFKAQPHLGPHPAPGCSPHQPPTSLMYVLGVYVIDS